MQPVCRLSITVVSLSSLGSSFGTLYKKFRLFALFVLWMACVVVPVEGENKTTERER